MRYINYFVVLALLVMPLAAQAAPSKQTAAPAVVTKTTSGINILSSQDVELYKQIFQAQKKGNVKEADALLKKVDNDILKGHVLADRYLHPTAYQSSYGEFTNLG